MRKVLIGNIFLAGCLVADSRLHGDVRWDSRRCTVSFQVETGRTEKGKFKRSEVDKFVVYTHLGTVVKNEKRAEILELHRLKQIHNVLDAILTKGSLEIAEEFKRLSDEVQKQNEVKTGQTDLGFRSLLEQE